MRRATGLLRHLCAHGESACASAVPAIRLLPAFAAEANPLAYAGVSQLVSCANFSGRHGDTGPHAGGRSFSSGPVDLDASEAAAAASGPSALDPQLIADACGAAEIDALAAAAEMAWIPTRGLLNLLGFVHLNLDLPWITTIAATTAAVRTLMFPVMVYQMKNTARMSAARPEMEVLMKWLKERQASAGPGTDMQAVQAEYWARINQIWQKYDCNPAKSMVSLAVQAPAFLCFFAGLRHLASAKVPSMMDGGALWFTDLTVADPTYALPVLCSLSFLATVELGAADGMQGQPPAMLKRMKMIMRGLSVVILPFTASMPAGVFVYWIASNFFSMGQTALLKSNALRKTLGLPLLGLGAMPGAAPAQPAATFSSKPAATSRPAASQAAAQAAPGPQTYDVTPLPPKPAGAKSKRSRNRSKNSR